MTNYNSYSKFWVLTPAVILTLLPPILGIVYISFGIIYSDSMEIFLPIGLSWLSLAFTFCGGLKFLKTVSTRRRNKLTKCTPCYVFNSRSCLSFHNDHSSNKPCYGVLFFRTRFGRNSCGSIDFPLTQIYALPTMQSRLGWLQR